MPRSLRRKEGRYPEDLRSRANESAQACCYCGCTDDRACASGCWWVEPGLCSSCAEVPEL